MNIYRQAIKDSIQLLLGTLFIILGIIFIIGAIVGVCYLLVQWFGETYGPIAIIFFFILLVLVFMVRERIKEIKEQQEKTSTKHETKH